MRRAYAQGLSLSLDCMLLMRYFLPGCASLLHLEKAFRIIHALFELGKILSTFCFLLYAYFPFAISLSLSLFSCALLLFPVIFLSKLLLLFARSSYLGSVSDSMRCSGRLNVDYAYYALLHRSSSPH